MSINMTQDFAFETDELKSFRVVLKSIIPVLFKKNGKYVQLHIDTSEKQNWGWRDGKYECGSNYKEHEVVYYANQYHVIEDDTMYHGAKQHKVVSSHNDKDEACNKAVAFNRQNEPKAFRKFICKLGDYKEEYKDKTGITFCDNYEDMLADTIAIINNVNPEVFKKEFFDASIRSFDGSLGIAYRMHYEPQGGWNKLLISMTWAYYGK